MHERCEFCGKKNFPTREWAAAMAAVYNHLNGWEAYPYHCREGEFWHLRTPAAIKMKYRKQYKKLAKAMRSLHEQRSNNDYDSSTQPEEG